MFFLIITIRPHVSWQAWKTLTRVIGLIPTLRSLSRSWAPTSWYSDIFFRNVSITKSERALQADLYTFGTTNVFQFAVGALYGSKVSEDHEQAVMAAVIMTFTREPYFYVSKNMTCHEDCIPSLKVWGDTYRSRKCDWLECGHNFPGQFQRFLYMRFRVSHCWSLHESSPGKGHSKWK